MREEQNRREQFSHGNVSTMLPPSVSGKQGSLLLQEQDSGASVSIDLEPAMGQLSLHKPIYDDTVSLTLCIVFLSYFYSIFQNSFNINYHIKLFILTKFL